MSLPRILYNDLSRTTFTSTLDAVTGYPILNLKDYIPSNKWIGNLTDAYPSSASVNIDLGSVQTIDTVVIENHNFDSCINGSIVIQCADDSNYTTNLTTLFTNLEESEYLYSGELGATVSKRYLRIHYTGSFYENPRIGNIFAGKMMELNIPYTYGYRTNNYKYNTIERTALSGIKRNSQSNTVNKSVYELDFRFQNDTTKNNFITFIKAIRGKSLPFYFFNVDDEVTYVNSESDYQPVEVVKYGLNQINTLVMSGFRTQVTSTNGVNIDLILDDDCVTDVL